MENNRTSQTGSQSEDPRIDSPEIRVVYPSEPARPIDPKPIDPLKPTQGIQTPVTAQVTTQPAPTTQPVQSTTAEACTCGKITWLDALKQNVTPFLLLALGVLAVGYLIGKNK